MLISDQGTLVRTRVDEVSLLGRNTQGVTLIKLAEGETLVGLERRAGAVRTMARIAGRARSEGEAIEPERKKR